MWPGALPIHSVVFCSPGSTSTRCLEASGASADFCSRAFPFRSGVARPWFGFDVLSRGFWSAGRRSSCDAPVRFGSMWLGGMRLRTIDSVVSAPTARSRKFSGRSDLLDALRSAHFHHSADAFRAMPFGWFSAPSQHYRSAILRRSRQALSTGPVYLVAPTDRRRHRSDSHSARSRGLRLGGAAQHRMTYQVVHRRPNRGHLPSQAWSRATPKLFGDQPRRLVGRIRPR